MGKRVNFTVTASSAASPAAVWELVRDGVTWPTWSPIDSFELAETNADGVEGVGAVRIFTTSFVHSREELLVMEPNKQLSYTALAGMPFLDHRADVVLTPNGSGTVISWREDFIAKIPGTAGFFRWFLGRFVQQCADGLAKHATTVAAENLAG